MTRLVARILAAKQREAEADTSALERDIDELVYALYGLPRKKKPSCKPPPNESVTIRVHPWLRIFTFPAFFRGQPTPDPSEEGNSDFV